jgi:hypothetical protein
MQGLRTAFDSNLISVMYYVTHKLRQNAIYLNKVSGIRILTKYNVHSYFPIIM